MNDLIKNQFPKALEALEEVDKFISEKGFLYGDDDCVASEFEQIANDSHAILSSLIARAYRLKNRIERSAPPPIENNG